VLFLCVFAFVLVGVRVWSGGGGCRVVLSGFVVGLRWCSWLSVGFLFWSAVSVWLLGLRGASLSWFGWSVGWCVFGFGVVLVVWLVGCARPVCGSAVVLPPGRSFSPVLWCGRCVRLCGGSARLVGSGCPFSVVVRVSVPVGAARVVFGWSSSGAVSSSVLSSLRSRGSVASLVPGSSSVVGGVCVFRVVVFVGPSV